MHNPFTSGLKWPAKALAFALAMQLASFPVPGQTLPTALSVVVVEGEGATGQVKQRPDRIPVVRVVDEKQQPVSGAAVVFTLPTEGSTGEFPGGNKSLMIVTDAQGTASAQGLRFNQIPGKVPINVNASYKGLTARTNLMLLSQAPAGYKPSSSGSHTGRLIVILALVAAGVAGGAFAATHSSGSSSSSSTPPPSGPQPIGITAGTTTIAPPH